MYHSSCPPSELCICIMCTALTILFEWIRHREILLWKKLSVPMRSTLLPLRAARRDEGLNSNQSPAHPLPLCFLTSMLFRALICTRPFLFPKRHRRRRHKTSFSRIPTCTHTHTHTHTHHRIFLTLMLPSSAPEGARQIAHVSFPFL